MLACAAPFGQRAGLAPRHLTCLQFGGASLRTVATYAASKIATRTPRGLASAFRLAFQLACRRAAVEPQAGPPSAARVGRVGCSGAAVGCSGTSAARCRGLFGQRRWAAREPASAYRVQAAVMSLQVAAAAWASRWAGLPRASRSRWAPASARPRCSPQRHARALRIAHPCCRAPAGAACAGRSAARWCPTGRVGR